MSVVKRRPSFVQSAARKAGKSAQLRPPREASVEMHLEEAIQAVVVGRSHHAASLFEQVLSQRPQSVAALHGMAITHLQRGHLAEGVRWAFDAHGLEPENDEVVRTLVTFLMKMLRYERAEELLLEYLERNPHCVFGLSQLGTLLTFMARHEEAHDYLEQAEALCSDPSRRGSLAVARSSLAIWDDLPARRATIVDDLHTSMASGQIPSVSPFMAVMLNLPKQLIRKLTRYLSPEVSENAFYPRGSICPDFGRPKLRIGYLSPDLNQHPVGLLMAPILESVDRTQFETYIYSLRTTNDEVRKRINRAADAVIRLDDVADNLVAERIFGDQVDILVDLVGFTQSGRPGVLAHRPAPVQAHFLGFPGSLPSTLVDYHILSAMRLGDDGIADYDEAIALLPETFIASEGFAMPETIPTRAQLGLPEDRFIFGFFGATYRIEPRVFDAWMKILERVPQAVMGIQNGHEKTQCNLRREAELRGIDPSRLYFFDWGILSQKWHHTLCDLWLDGWHVSSGTASIIAAWTGTPLLTLAGQTPQSRTGAAVLAGASLHDLVAHSEAAYVDRAVQLAEGSELSDIRKRMERRDTPLFQVPRFTRHLELAFKTMVERARRGRPPETFSVDPIAEEKSAA